MSAAERHMDFEENEIFPAVADLDLDGIGESLRALKKEYVCKMAQNKRGFTPQTLLYEEPEQRHSA